MRWMLELLVVLRAVLDTRSQSPNVRFAVDHDGSGEWCKSSGYHVEFDGQFDIAAS